MITRICHALRSGPAKNLLAGYFAFISTSIFGFVSIPLSVHFLGKQEIGLWNIVSQLTAYLLLLELGVGAAAGRLLADSLMSAKQATIDTAWSTLLAILAAQSSIILVVGLLLTPWLQVLFQIPEGLAGDARFLWVGMTLLHASGFPLRAYSGMLFCQERFHWTLLISGVTPWIQLLVFAALLWLGHGLKSYIFATLSVYVCQFFCLRYLVHGTSQAVRFRRKFISWLHAKPMLRYGFSMMLWSIAPALFASIPPIVLGRSLGLEFVAVYLISFRIPQMVAMVALRGFHSFLPKIQNLFIQGERCRFLRFYRFACSLSLLLTGFGLVLAILVNRQVVCWLAKPDFYAGDSVTLWFALGFIIIAVGEHLGTLFIIAGKGRWISIILVIEWLVTLATSFIFTRSYGLPGLAASLAIGPLLVRIPYYLSFGPKTCAYSASELYGKPVLALTSCLLMTTLAIAHQRLNPDISSQASFAGLALITIAITLITSKQLWQDFMQLGNTTQ